MTAFQQNLPPNLQAGIPAEASFIEDGNTNIIGVRHKWGSSISQIRRADARLTTVFIGDSIPVQWTSPASGYPTIVTSYSAFHWANAINGAPWEVIGSFGVNGITTSQLITGNQIIQTIASAPLACEVLIGQNDFSGGAGASATITNLTSIWQQLVNAGIYVRAYTILPRNDLAQKSFFGNLLSVNNFIKDYWRNNPNGESVDFYQCTANPTSTTLATLAQNTNDGIVHPNMQAAFTWAQTVLQPALTKWGTAQPLLPSTSMEDPAQATTVSNLSPNPMFQGTGGSNGTNSSGTVPTGCTVIGSANVACVNTNPSRSDGFGNNLQVTCTASAAGTATVQMPVAVSPGNFIANRLTYFVCSLSIAANPSNLTGLQCQLGGLSTPSWFMQNTATPGSFTSTTAVNLIVRTPMVSSGASNGTFSVTFNLVFGAAGSATLSWGRQAIYQRAF